MLLAAIAALAWFMVSRRQSRQWADGGGGGGGGGAYNQSNIPPQEKGYNQGAGVGGGMEQTGNDGFGARNQPLRYPDGDTAVPSGAVQGDY